MGCAFYFISYDCKEPPHVHIGDDVRKICKYWLRNNKTTLSIIPGFQSLNLSK
ncbi:MAG: DUF4160 domain-containing protein [Chitinophagaceae bacterium]